MKNYITLLVFTLTICAFPVIVSASSNDFTLEDMEGDLFTLSENLGKGPILLNFWATWCSPCKHELPHLQELMEKYEEQGFQLYTISIDSPKSQSKIKPYVKSKRFTFPVLLDTNSEVLKQFQGNSVPFQVLLDKEGNIVETHTGYNPGDEKILEEKIIKLLKSGSSDE